MAFIQYSAMLPEERSYQISIASCVMASKEIQNAIDTDATAA